MAGMIYTDAGAQIEGAFRYRLWRQWKPGPRLTYVMLNPSTANELEDDPTIRKCVGFADRLGYGGIEVFNLYPYRATRPADLMAWLYPTHASRGQIEKRFEEVTAAENRNDNEIYCWARKSPAMVLAWGARGHLGPSTLNGVSPFRVRTVRDLAFNCCPCVGVLAYNANGTPAHPLMLPYSCVAGSRLHANLTRPIV